MLQASDSSIGQGYTTAVVVMCRSAWSGLALAVRGMVSVQAQCHGAQCKLTDPARKGVVVELQTF